MLRADPRSRVPAADVVRAVRRAADTSGLDVEELLARSASARLAGAWQRTVRELDLSRRRARWPAPSIPADVAQRLLTAAGLDPTRELGQQTPTGRFRDRLARALQHLDDRVDVRLPGVDLALSSPKSVSVLCALTDTDTDDHADQHADHPGGHRGAGSGATAGGAVAGPTNGVAGLVRDAHRHAVQASVDYLELTCTSALRGHHRGDDTDTRIDTDGLVGAAFEHRSSRCGDPQLHTHVVVANLLHGVDGKWSALDTREIYAHARTAGFVYQAVLRGELTRTLGVAWGPVRNGQAEISGLPEGLLRLFSKRRAQIEAQLDLFGLDGPAAAQAATLATRPAKPRTEHPAEPAAGERSLRQRWQTEAADAGFAPSQVAGALGVVPASERVAAQRQAAAVSGPLVEGLGEQLLASTGLTSKRSTFDRRDLLRAVCEHLPAGTPVSLTTLRALATRVLRDARVVPLLGDAPVSARRYSTRELLLLENDAVQVATARADSQLATVPAAVLAAAQLQAQTRGLTAEQTAMLQRLLTSGAGVDVVVGAAGSGKTAALAVAAQAWQQAGIAVQGTALAAIAARVLQDSAGIESQSLTRLLNHTGTANPDGTTGSLLAPGGVLVLDEAGMVGTRTLHQLITLTERTGTKLVLVGDPKQLPEIDAGGLFATLAQRLPATTLDGNQRQRQRWEQRALRELRDGDVLHALSAYSRHDRLRVTDTLTELTEQILNDYQTARSTHAPEQVLVVASSRGDARRLNARLRERLLADGHLGPDELRIPLGGRGRDGGDGGDGRERGYRLGEQVLVTANDYPRGLLNGTRGTVTAVHLDSDSDSDTAGDGDGDGVRLTVRLDDGRHTVLDADYLRTGHLAHGYALTAHKAQGTTVDVALLWGTHALTRETGYVAMSRGRQANYLYATWDTLRRDTGDADLDRPRAGVRGPDPAARRGLARAALAERLGVSSRQRTARSWWRPRPPSHQPAPAASTVPHLRAGRESRTRGAWPG